MKKNNQEDQILNFEDNLKALDEVVKQLEEADLPLSEALSAFEDGISLFKACKNVLNKADEKVKLLIESSELGEMVEVDFEE